MQDNQNRVSYIEYTTISEKSIIRIKMKDESFKADYKFKLVSLDKQKIILKKGEGLIVEFSFDANMANGAWIMTQFDGKS